MEERRLFSNIQVIIIINFFFYNYEMFLREKHLLSIRERSCLLWDHFC